MVEEKGARRYEIIEEIGRGAMGVVLRAHDTLMDREVAIKVLSLPQGLDEKEKEELISRFSREAQAAGRLSGHHNIVTTHDVGSQDEMYFIAMELVRGEQLTSLIEKGPIPFTRAIDIMLQICEAMDHAHSRGIIHRDLKPDNIFVLPDGMIKIADFGIAKVLSKGTLTEVGMTIGTPGYMSPEQVKGSRIRPASDIFAAGVILYELLCGENPFEYGLDEPSYTSIIYRVVNEDPVPLLEIDPETPPEFDLIVGRAIRRNPTDRYASFKEFESDLLLVAGKLGEYDYHVTRPPMSEELIADKPGGVPGVKQLTLRRASERPSEVEPAEGVEGPEERVAFAIEASEDKAVETVDTVTGSIATVFTKDPGLDAGDRGVQLQGPEMEFEETARASLEDVAGPTGVVEHVETYEGPQPGKGISRKKKLAIVMISAAALLLIGLIVWWLVPPPPPPKPTVPTVKVPDVVGLQQDEAKGKVEAEGLVFASELTPDPDHEPGSVLQQEPKGDGDAEKGSTVAVIVAGPKAVTVPNLVGMSYGDACSLLDSGYLSHSNTEHPIEDQGQDGIILVQDPAPDTTVESGSVVAMTTGKYVARPVEPEKRTCSACGGSGTITESGIIGYQNVWVVCPTCGGTGMTSTGPCPHCSGAGGWNTSEPVYGNVPATCPVCGGTGYLSFLIEKWTMASTSHCGCEE